MQERTPKGWTHKRLDDLGFVGRGKSRHRPRNDPSLYGGQYPFIQTGEIKAADLYISEYGETYNEKGLAQSKLWPAGTLCITIAANIAETAILKMAACFPDSVVGFIADSQEADTRFVKYQIDTIKLRMQNISHGTTQDNLSLEKLLSFDLLVPPVAIQRRIGSIIGAYDELVEHNLRRVAILEEMVRAIYQEWFVEFLAPGVKLRKATPMERKATGKSDFPIGWELKALGDLAEEVRKGVQPDEVDPGMPYIGLEHLPRRSIAIDEWGEARHVHSTKLAFRAGDILFGKIRPYFHKVGIAPLDGICSSDTIVIVPKSIEYRALVLACVSSDDFVKHASQTSQGSKMPRANWQVLVKYSVAVPGGPLLQEFGEHMSGLTGLIHNLIFVNRNLRQTRDLLLPRLLSGEASVENLEIDTADRQGQEVAEVST